MRIASALDFRVAAKGRLPRFLFDYIDGAAYSELTARRNIADLEGIALRQRVLVDVSATDLHVRLFGRNHGMPVILGPVGLAGMYARRGEVQAARAAASRGVTMCLSSASICSLKEVSAANSTPLWFQLYMVRDRAFMVDVLAVAEEAGCEVMVLTVDLPVPGARYRDVHSGLSGRYARFRRLAQAAARPRWAWDVGIRGRPHSLGNFVPLLGRKSGLEDFMGWIGRNFDPSITWRDLDWIRSHWRGTLVIKGILEVEDAREAARLGADGLVVSNHGGRQLDGVHSTARALPAIVDEVGDALTVLADGGVRSGLDVVRMLALGARSVLIGRAWAYALAAQGKTGVGKLLDILAAEMQVAMALTGVTNVAQINRDIISRAS